MIVRRLTEKFDMSFGQGLSDFAKNEECLAQNVRTRLQLLQDEWFLDVDAGVPWLQEIMVRPAQLPLVESIIKQTILETDGVLSLTDFDLQFSTETRTIFITCTVINEFSTTQNIKVIL